jgi:hypothetical protein
MSSAMQYERAMPVDRIEQRHARACNFFPWLAAGVVFLSAVQVAVLTSSLVSLRLTRLVALGVLVVALLTTWLVWRGLKADGQTAPPWAGISEQRWGRSMAGLFAALYVFLFACAATVPDLSWDGNSYHLPTIQQWFQTGRVAWVEGPEPSILQFINGYPKAAEVMALFLCTLIHPALSHTVNLVYLPLGMLGIASIAQALGAAPGAALAAGAAFLLVPINLGQSLTAYVDSAFGSAVIAWLAVTIALRRLDAKRLGIEALVLGCALGNVIGIKGTGLLLGAVGTLALVAVHLAARPPGLSLRTLLTWWVGVAVCALGVGGWWYIRNLVHGHSPIYPIGVSLAGVTLLPGYDAYAPAGAFAVDGLIEHWPAPAQIAFTWLQGLWFWPTSIVGFDPRLGGLGFLWALGCLPAVVALVRQRLRLRAAWRDELVREPLWLLLAIVGAGIVVMPCPWWSRFTIWVYGLGLPCLAAAQPSWTGRFGRRWLWGCVAIALLEAGIVVARWQVPLVGVAISAALGEPRAPRHPIPSHFFPPWALRGSLIEQLAGSHDTIGVVPLPWWAEPVVGVLSQPVGVRQIYFVPENLEADFAPWYERVHPRYVIMETRDEIPEPMARLQPQVHEQGSLTVLQFW